MTNFMLRFWRGDIPLGKTFWLGWAIPVIGGNLLVASAAGWLIINLGFVASCVAAALVVAYSFIAVVPVWRSATNHNRSIAIKYAARAIASVVSAIQLLAVCSAVYALFSIKPGLDSSHDSERVAEKTAIPSASHPMAGFWKSSPTDNFGLAIAPAEGKSYSVSFCGPGGCFSPGTYRPNTPLVNDEDYQVVSNDILRIRGLDGWSTYHRAPSRGDDDCPPK